MKEQLMDASTRAAFQGLIAAAAAIGIGALLTGNFFDRSGRRDRDVGLTVFEDFSVVAILTGSFMTGYFSIEYLRTGQAVSDVQFGQVGAPLVVSVVLLVLLRTTARFSALPGGVGNHIPTISVTVLAALTVAFMVTLQSAQPEYIVPAGGALLAVGALLGGAFLLIERRWLNDNRRMARRRIASLASKGYKPAESLLLPALPGTSGFAIVCWSKKGRTYLDQTECRRLLAEVDRRWGDWAAGKNLPPLGDSMLTRIDLKTTALPWPPRLTLTTETSGLGERESRSQRLMVNSDGLFDVTDLSFV